MAAGCFEVAALPEPAVPAWADAVREALCDAGDEGAEITMQRDDPEVRRRALHLSVRCHALRACSYWGWDPLPLNDIERVAQIVCSQTAQVNARAVLEFQAVALVLAPAAVALCGLLAGFGESLVGGFAGVFSGVVALPCVGAGGVAFVVVDQECGDSGGQQCAVGVGGFGGHGARPVVVGGGDGVQRGGGLVFGPAPHLRSLFGVSFIERRRVDAEMVFIAGAGHADVGHRARSAVRQQGPADAAGAVVADGHALGGVHGGGVAQGDVLAAVVAFEDDRALSVSRSAAIGPASASTQATRQRLPLRTWSMRSPRR